MYYFAPEFDYEPQSEEAAQAYEADMAALPQFRPAMSAPSAADLPGLDEFQTIPTQEDYTAPVMDQLNATTLAAQELDAQGKAAAEAYAREQARSPHDRAAEQIYGAGTGMQGESMGAFGAAGTPPSYVQVNDPLHGPVVEKVGTDASANAAIMGATQAGHDAQAQAEAALIPKYEKLRQWYEADAAARQDTEALHAQAIADQQKFIRDAQSRLDKAAKTLASAPEENPSAFWESKNGFQIFALTLSAIAKGWLMGQGMNIDPMGNINAAIERDIQAQRQNRAKLAQNIDAIGAVKNEAHKVFGELRGNIQDERLSSGLVREARLREAHAEFVKMAQEAKVQQLLPEQEVFLQKLRKEIGAQQLENEALLAKHPATRTVAVRPKLVRLPNGQMVTPEDARWIARETFKEGGQARGKALDTVSAGAGAESQGRIEGMKISAKREEDARQAEHQLKRGAHGYLQEAKEFTHKFEKELAVVSAIRQIQEQYPSGTNIPGVNVTGKNSVTIGSGKDAQLIKALDNIEEGFSRSSTGAARSAEEIEVFHDLLYSGLIGGGDDRLRANLDAVQNYIVQRILPAESAMSDEARTWLWRNNVLPQPAASEGWAGYNNTDGVVEDE